MPGERDGACEAFDCAYRSPIRREAGVQAFCANGERGVDDAHAAAPELGERLEVRAVERGQTVRLGRGGRTPRGRIPPGGYHKK